MAKPKKDGGPKQKLSPIARRKKAIRDKKFAMTAERKAKKAEAQRKRREQLKSVLPTSKNVSPILSLLI